MTTLYITEYATMSQIPNAGGQMPQEPPIAKQVITGVSAVSQQSAVFNAKTRFVRLNCDGPCSTVFGVNPTATTTDGRMSPNQTEYHGVPEGGGLQVAVVSNA